MTDRPLFNRTLFLATLLIAAAATAVVGCDDGEGDPVEDAMDVADVDDVPDTEPDTTPVECDEETACDAPSAECDGVYLVTCAEDANGCLVETTTNCGFAGQGFVCDDDADPAVCAAPGADCEDVTTCDAPMRACNGEVLEICAADANGCLVPSTRNCVDEGLICDETGAMPSCQPPDCDSECLVVDELSCDGSLLERCQDSDGDGCRERVAEMDCADNGEFCNSAGTTAGCLAHSAGRSCQQPIVVTDGFGHYTGDDLVTEFGDAHTWFEGFECDKTSPSNASAEIVFEVALDTNDTLYVTDDSSVEVIRRVVDSCEDNSDCLASELASNDEPLVYNASEPETVYVVVETFSRQPFSPQYDITIEVEAAVCGNASRTPNEACDDGNTVDGDGCSADCLTVENGYTCFPGFCFLSDQGEACDAPIPIAPPMTFDFATLSFNDDYDTYTSCNDGGGLGPDAVFSVDLAADDVLYVSAPETNFDASISVATGCPDVEGSCQSYDASLSNPEFTAYHNGSGSTQTVFVVLDGGSRFQTNAGRATLDFSVHPLVCGDTLIDGPEQCDDGNTEDNDGCSSTCQIEGDTCTEPLTVTTFPFQAPITTTGYTNSYEGYTACSGDGGAGPDRIYEVDVPASQVLRVVASGQDYNAAVVLSQGCPDVAESCTDYGASGDAPIRKTRLNTSAETETWYVVFDNASLAAVDGDLEATIDVYAPSCGDGYIDSEVCDDGNTVDGDGCSQFCTVEANNQCYGEPSLCAGSTQGNTCGSAIALPGPGHYGGDTVLMRSNAITSHMGCPGVFGMYGEAADSVFSVSLAANETLEAVLVPPPDADLGLSVVTGPAANCGAINATTCVDFDDGSPAGGNESVSYTATSAQTVFLIVDGRAATDVGPFELFVDIAPAP